MRVGVDGDRQHIRAFVEDILRAVAAVIVNVEHSATFPLAESQFAATEALLMKQYPPA